MKVCPKCKAELEDHARFCLRCMTSLDEKTPIPQPARKRRLWPFALIFAALVLAVTCIWRFAPAEEPSVAVPGSPAAPTQAAVPTTTAPQPTETAGTTTPAAGSTIQYITVYPQGGTYVPAGTTTATTPTSSTPSTPSTSTTKPTGNSTNTTQPTQATKPPVSTMPPNTAIMPNGVAYTYREKNKAEIALGACWYGAADGVVITGVSSPSPDGIYEIHRDMTLADGSTFRIAGVDSYAFAGTNARYVSLLSIRFVHENAFYGCPMERLYICDSLYFHQNACAGCPEGFTMATEAGLTTDFYTGNIFEFSAAYYGAVWEEELWESTDYCWCY